ncbi:zinc ribbon domain-containing protein [Blastopirellula sp. JC732]|uniref:Zinc ribbon domain-containing protein n=1 Tax=Blastopirellula sediminis TaxID=2894196 RepID=A0A9X1MQ31_9BACT|nr:zinc ribbon domain-containing protein [Blastopirellula sediminis]MCC9606325.1 zinc ribbon domain-containing protein [Blastopirellula sediminis]MCC9630377.1 zinc ribbon domain-containing protein [Blastopirellula sediminis]
MSRWDEDDLDDDESFVDDEAWTDDDLPSDEPDDYLDHCPQCGGEIYDDADVCPHCGEYLIHRNSPWSDRSFLWVALGLLGVIAVIASLFFGF